MDTNPRGKRANEGFITWLRERTMDAMGRCQTCGHLNGDYRKHAEQIGVAPSSLWRFIQGRQPSGPLVDKLVEWLDERDRQVRADRGQKESAR